jgi:hypothetical protein
LGVTGLGWGTIHALTGGCDDYSNQKNAGLYFVVDAIESISLVLREKAEIVETNPKTEYGKKEIVFRDLNGFQITFGCSLLSTMLDRKCSKITQ